MFLFSHTNFHWGYLVYFEFQSLQHTWRWDSKRFASSSVISCWFYEVDSNCTEEDDNAYEKKIQTTIEQYPLHTTPSTGRHEISAILLFLATSGTMKDVENHKKATMERIKMQYWGKGIYFSMEMPLPSSSSQIIMTINNTYCYQNSFVL